MGLNTAAESRPRAGLTLSAFLAFLLSVVTIFLTPVPTAAQATNADPPPYAFANTVPGASSIALRTSDAIRQLTANPTVDVRDDQPALSPDGAKIAFRRSTGSAENNHTDIYVMSTVGGVLVQVTHGYIASRPAWSSATTLVFGAYDPAIGFQLHQINIDGTGDILFAASNGGGDPAACHDGNIAYSAGGIYVVGGPTDTHPRQLTNENDAENPAWTPDCRYIVYDVWHPVSDQSFIPAEIYAVPVAGGKVVQLTSGGSNTQPVVSSDWTMAYQHHPAGSGGLEIWVQWLGGSEARAMPVAAPYDINGWPSFQPASSNTPAPTGFPIALGVPTPTPTPLSTRPVVTSVSVNPPALGDAEFMRGITVKAKANGSQISHFEYGWARSGVGASSPRVDTIQRSDWTNNRIDFRPTNPNETWLLFARGVNADGTAGDWSAPTQVKTPDGLALIFIGDSITSGHRNLNGRTECHDDNYGYAAAYRAKWLNAQPAQWRVKATVVNLAQSGFASQIGPGSIINGSVVEGGTDACRRRGIRSPLADARKVLGSRSGTWKQVVGTAGIDDTNWVETVVALVTAEVAHEIQHKSLPLTPSECSATLKASWNGYQNNVRTSITSGIHKIVARLRGVDPTVSFTWLLYYNIAGTGTNNIRFTPYMPDTCDGAIQDAMTQVNSAVQAGLPSDATIVNSDSVMHGIDTRMQPLLAIRALLDSHNPAGWPHPNMDGGQSIATLIAP